MPKWALSSKKCIQTGIVKKYIKIGKRIKELRRNISQKAFAKSIDVPFRTYQRYEHGERMPPGHVLQRIAQNCNVTVDYILTGDVEAFKQHVAQISDQIDKYGDRVDDLGRRILLLLQDMPEEDVRAILRSIEDKKLLRELLEERKKLKDVG